MKSRSVVRGGWGGGGGGAGGGANLDTHVVVDVKQNEMSSNVQRENEFTVIRAQAAES